MKVRTGLGQDSHRFTNSEKILVLGGIEVKNHRGLSGNSDADVVLHAITNAISSISGVTVLGKKADEMCENGITDSSEYLKEALKDLKGDISHLAISIESKTPKINPIVPEMRQNIANLLNISTEDIGITATTGEELTDFGKGLGIQVFAILTVIDNLK
jgi:2-C-methyl-D-erythritol 2,4-cyclodiphosphate synthase